MKSKASTLRRLVVRMSAGLLLLAGLCLSLGVQTHAAHAATTLTVSNCSSDSQLQADVSTANSDNAGDTITFSCSGDIPLSKTLYIGGSMTIDGSGQNVTLDGSNITNSSNILVVNSGVKFALNALTVTHGETSKGTNGVLVNNFGTVSISNSAFVNNLGAGLDNEGGTVNVSNSTFAYNQGGNGGGLFNFGTMSLTNSTIVNNQASSGGGLDNFRGSTVNISNSTIANNTAPGGEGGGLFNSGTININNSIVANNTASSGGNCSGTITDQGYNLESGTDCGFIASTDLQSTDPKLDPNGLQNNGGPTQTMALQQGSPAIDQIPAASCPATDQRGDVRPDNAETTCDMGAYEFVDPPPDTDLGLTSMPTNITTNATSPQGAVVTYTLPTVVDEDSPLPTVSCLPASGSTFAIGNTTVSCSVSDSDDTNSPVSASFTVTVNGAAAQVSNLIATVNSFNLQPPSIQTSFDSQLQAVQADLTNNNTAQACSDLTSFINHAQAQSGKHLTVSQANQLIAAAKQVQAVLGC